MSIPEDNSWGLELLGKFNGRVVGLVLEVGRGGEEETEGGLTGC